MINLGRVARERSDTGIYHIIIRGINKQNIFEDEEDRDRFIDTLRIYKDISKFKLYAYCLMTNHIHLLIKEEDESISQAIKRISSSYVKWYNGKYERCGHLFQDRFKSEVVENEIYLLTVIRYIHQNPVKAHLVNKVEEYPWSSYCEYLDQSLIVDKDMVLGIVSKDNEKSIEGFIAFNSISNDDECMDIEDQQKLSDRSLVEYILGYGIKNINEINKLEIEKRNIIILKILKRGASMNQLARVTGIPKSTISRIKSRTQ